ncbi:hypothetical protein ACFWVP_16925 [Streptomyces sp. NPDC058637]|uniref:hypothetical protein n=1 Tax=Streptomyces sp. NPDC058637 TaxID=3346569 RepID=UPI00364ADBA0
MALPARLARAMDAAFSLEADGGGFRVAYTAIAASGDDRADPAPAAAGATDTGAKQAATV